MVRLKGLYRWKLVNKDTGKVDLEGEQWNVVTDGFIRLNTYNYDRLAGDSRYDGFAIFLSETTPLPSVELRQYRVADANIVRAETTARIFQTTDTPNNRLYAAYNFSPPVSERTITVIGVDGYVGRYSGGSGSEPMISFIELTTPITQADNQFLYVQYNMYAEFILGGANAPDNAFLRYYLNQDLIGYGYTKFYIGDYNSPTPKSGLYAYLCQFLPASDVNNIGRLPYVLLQLTGMTTNVGTQWGYRYYHQLSTTAWTGPVGSIVYTGRESSDTEEVIPLSWAYSPAEVDPSISRIFVHAAGRYQDSFSNPAYPPSSRASISISGTPTNKLTANCKVVITKTGDASDIDTNSYSGTSGNDYLTMGSSDWVVGDQIELDSNAPAPLDDVTEYYVVDKNGNDIKLSETDVGSPITLTGTDSGTATRVNTGRYQLEINPWSGYVSSWDNLAPMEDNDGNVQSMDNWLVNQEPASIKGKFRYGDYIYCFCQAAGRFPIDIARQRYATVETAVPFLKFGSEVELERFQGHTEGAGTYAGHVYIATSKGLYDWDMSSPSTPPALMSITSLVETDIRDVVFDEATEFLWVGTMDGVRKIDLSTNTMVREYSRAHGEFATMVSDGEVIFPYQLTAHNGRVVRGGYQKGGTSEYVGYSSCWCIDDNIPGWVMVHQSSSSSDFLAGGRLNKYTGNIVTYRRVSYQTLYWYTWDNVVVTGMGTGTAIYGSYATLGGGNGVLNGEPSLFFAQVGRDEWLTAHKPNGNRYVWNLYFYKEGTASATNTLIVETGYGAEDPVDDIQFMSGREPLKFDNGAICPSIKTLVFGFGAFGNQKFGWNGSSWEMGLDQDRPIPKTGTHPLPNGLTIDFNNSVGDPWDTQFIINERFHFVYGPFPIKDNLQEYTLQSRYYYCKSVGVEDDSISSIPLYYEIPGKSDGDFRDMDTLSYTIKIMDGSTRLTAVNLNGAVAFTADDSTDILTVADDIPTGAPVYLSSTEDLPSPLEVGWYWAINISSTQIKLAASYADAIATTPIDITDTGTGTHSYQVALPGADEYYANHAGGFFVFNPANAGNNLELTYNYTLY